MYAIMETGGFQFSVKEGDRIRTPKLKAQPREKFVFDKVIFIGGEKPQVGSPYIDGAKVQAEVVDSGKAGKVVVFKKKRRVKYRRTRGHRQHFTEFKIERIVSPR